MATQKPRIGLALGGGATYGYAHIGVLKALAEHNITVDCIAGTSAGALVGACYAFGIDTEKIIAASKELSWRKVSEFTVPSLGLVSNKPLAIYMAQVIGDVLIEEAPIPLAIVATNIETRKKIVFRKGNLGLALRASTGIPGIFAPTEVDGALLVDGGLVENVPVVTLKGFSPALTIGVNLQSHVASFRPQSIYDVLVISTTILTEHRDAHLAHHADILIEPDLSAFSAARFQDVDGMIDAGYDATIAQMPSIKEKLEQLMQPPSVWKRVLSWFGK